MLQKEACLQSFLDKLIGYLLFKLTHKKYNFADYRNKKVAYSSHKQLPIIGKSTFTKINLQDFYILTGHSHVCVATRPFLIGPIYIASIATLPLFKKVDFLGLFDHFPSTCRMTSML